MEVRPYDPGTERAALWALKRAFERDLGTATGDDGKARRYAEKLTDAYRDRYLRWVERCRSDDRRCVTVADHPGDGPVGYVFVLPERLAMVWDAAVLNEFYVAPAHRGGDTADELMAAALAVARGQELPLDRLVLDVDRENDRARAFYERHGFSPWGELVAREL